MARELLVAQNIDKDSLQAAYTEPTVDGYSAIPSSTQFLHVINGNAGTVVVTIPTPLTIDGLAVADRTISLLTTEEAFIDIRGQEYRQSASDPSVYIDFDIQSSVDVALLDLP